MKKYNGPEIYLFSVSQWRPDVALRHWRYKICGNGAELGVVSIYAMEILCGNIFWVVSWGVFGRGSISQIIMHLPRVATEGVPRASEKLSVSCENSSVSVELPPVQNIYSAVQQSHSPCYRVAML